MALGLVIFGLGIIIGAVAGGIGALAVIIKVCKP